MHHLKIAVFGLLSGLLFGVSNMYFGLQTGLTINASIPLSIISATLIHNHTIGKRGIIAVDSCLAQVFGTASSALSSGIIFTIPAVYLMDMDISYPQLLAISLAGIGFGYTIAFGLRKHFIAEPADTLPFPEGTVCAEVHSTITGQDSKAFYILAGLLLGLFPKLMVDLTGLIQDRITIQFPFIEYLSVGLSVSPALLGIGYLIGYPIASNIMAGNLIVTIVLIPLLCSFEFNSLLGRTASNFTAETYIWDQYIRFIGAGAISFAGILSIFKILPILSKSAKGCLMYISTSRSGSHAKLSLKYIVHSAYLTLMLVPLSIDLYSNGCMRFIHLGIVMGAVTCLSFLFATISSRIVGIIGASSNPTSGMTVTSLIIICSMLVQFSIPLDNVRFVVIVVSSVICIAASVAGSVTQDFKVGSVIGVGPIKQHYANLISFSFSIFLLPLFIWLLHSSFKFGSVEFPAPQAMLMKTLVESLTDSKLRLDLLFSGAALSLAASLVGAASLPFSIGVYIPSFVASGIFLGACTRRLFPGQSENPGGDISLLFCSGLIAGEALGGCVSVFFRLAGRPDLICTTTIGSNLTFSLFFILLPISIIAWLSRCKA